MAFVPLNVFAAPSTTVPVLPDSLLTTRLFVDKPPAEAMTPATVSVWPAAASINPALKPPPETGPMPMPRFELRVIVVLASKSPPDKTILSGDTVAGTTPKLPGFPAEAPSAETLTTPAPMVVAPT